MPTSVDNRTAPPAGAWRRGLLALGIGRGRISAAPQPVCNDHPPAREYGHFGPAAMVFPESEATADAPPPVMARSIQPPPRPLAEPELSAALLPRTGPLPWQLARAGKGPMLWPVAILPQRLRSPVGPISPPVAPQAGMFAGMDGVLDHLRAAPADAAEPAPLHEDLAAMIAAWSGGAEAVVPPPLLAPAPRLRRAPVAVPAAVPSDRWAAMLLAGLALLALLAGVMLTGQRPPPVQARLARPAPSATPGEFWLIGMAPNETALIGRLVPSGAGTVSLRVDLVSGAPGGERWDYLIACPAGAVLHRSGDRWRDRLRTVPLGLVDHTPDWEPRAVRFACQGDASGGPWPAFEAARDDAEQQMRGGNPLLDF